MNAPELNKPSSVRRPRRLYGAFRSERKLDPTKAGRHDAQTAREPGYDPGEVEAELGSLCRRYCARYIATWTRNPSNCGASTVVAVDQSEALQSAWLADVEDNSEVALRTRNRTTRTIETAPDFVVVSQVLPYDRSQAVSFVFPKSHLVDNVELLHEGLDHATARIAIVSLRKALHNRS